MFTLPNKRSIPLRRSAPPSSGFFSLFQICLKGKVHIFKYLNMQGCRLDKKPDTLDLPTLGKRCLLQPLTDRYGNQTAQLVFQFLHMSCMLPLPFPPSSPLTLLIFRSVLHICSMEDFYPNKNHGPDSGIGSDNGDKRLSTTEVRIQTRHVCPASLRDNHPTAEASRSLPHSCESTSR